MWIVAALLLLGLAGVAIRMVFFHSQAGSVDATISSGGGSGGGGASGGAGAAPWDPNVAKSRYQKVKQDLDDAISHSTLGPGDLDEARRFAEQYPHLAAAHSLLGQALYYDNQLAPAYEELMASLELDRQQAAVENLAGEIALRLGKPDDSLKHFSHAVDLEPSNQGYRLRLAEAYLDRHDMDRARTLLLESIRVAPRSAQAYALLSELYTQENKLPMAEAQIAKAITLLPDDQKQYRVVYTRKEAALLRRDNRPGDALRLLESLPIKDRDKADVIEDLALCWAMLGKPDKGADLYEHALKANRGDWRLAAGAAIWWLKAGDRDAARRNLNQLEKIDPDLPVVKELEAKLRAK